MMLCGCSRCTNIYPQVPYAWLPNYAVMICSIVLMKSCATGELRLIGETICAAERLSLRRMLCDNIWVVFVSFITIQEVIFLLVLMIISWNIEIRLNRYHIPYTLVKTPHGFYILQKNAKRLFILFCQFLFGKKYFFGSEWGALNWGYMVNSFLLLVN